MKRLGNFALYTHILAQTEGKCETSFVPFIPK